MKILNRNNALLTLLILALISFTACVEDDDFDTPSSEIIEPEFDPNTVFTTVSAVAGALSQEQDDNDGIFDPQPLDYSNENVTLTYEFNENDLILEAYVISSDEGGNFFEEILLQDDFENPTTGIKLLIDINPLFVRYDVGRKLYIKLNGLSVGMTNGVLTLGQANGNEVDKISPADEFNVIQRSSEKRDIVPLPLQFSEFTEDKTNLFVQLQDVQFNRNEAGQLSYASEASDQFDGERTLESCAESTSVVFSTSTFADFGPATLATGRGTINGILTRNFEGENFNIVVNTLEDVLLDNPERCDPDFLECTGPSGGGSAIFSEDFETFSNFTAEGWTNVNINGGGLDWIEGSFGGNSYAQISGFNSDEDDIDVWLVTPAINLDATSGEEFSFDIQVNFDNGNILRVLASTDFTGDVTTATWQPLDVTIPNGPA
ncbi:MAG: DUF5689 domain-containing protein, partial [Bacteroidota bacterium]